MHAGHAEAHRTVRVRVASAFAAISPPRRHKAFCNALLPPLTHLQAGNGHATRLLISVGRVTVTRPPYSHYLEALPLELPLVKGYSNECRSWGARAD